MLKKNLSIILIVLVALMLIVIVIRVFDRRIRDIEKKTDNATMLVK
jgi:hypothetical protein